MAPARKPPLLLLLAGTVGLAMAMTPTDAAAQEEEWRTDFSKHTVPLDEIVSGGPPKDGIPAIDRPRFISVGEADGWLSDDSPVAVVATGGVTKAYPLQILTWHEIVNDRVGGIPVTVTFCPLCNTTLAFDRRFDGKVLDFGTTGRLRHSDLVMYDRQTETWWQQATGEAIVGRYAGEELDFIPSPVLGWEDVKEEHPEAAVLSRETGYQRDYGRNPYRGYDRRSGPIDRFFGGDTDDRLPAMHRVVALHRGEESVAVPFELLREERVVEVTVGGREVVVFWVPGTASALDASRIADGRDVGSAAVYEPVADGRRLHFSFAGDGRFEDGETGSTWTIGGEAVAGPLTGTELEAVAHGDHFWFAWVAFRPGTRVVER